MDDLHKFWSHRWLNPKLEVRNSTIHGSGTFAAEAIRKDQTIAIYGGIVVPQEDIYEYRKKIGGIRGIQISDHFFICPTEQEGGLFNHSCEPNMGLKSQIEYIAIRDIDVGEEVVPSYAFTESDFGEFSCHCRTNSCRKTIRPNDWESDELHKKYHNFFSPYLKRRYEALKKQ